MVRNKEELMAAIKTRIGDDTSDEALALVEDINDSFDDLSNRVSEAGDWKAKYEENDKQWRDKYRERFFAPTDEDDPLTTEMQQEEPEKPKALRYEDLFKSE